MNQQAYKVVFANTSNKDNLDIDADIVVILPDDRKTYYNNLPMGVKYIFSCTTNKKYVKIPFDCEFKHVKKGYLAKGGQIIQFELLEKVKIISEVEELKDITPSYKKVNGNHTYTFNGVKWSKITKHYKTKNQYSCLVEISDDEE